MRLLFLFALLWGATFAPGLARAAKDEDSAKRGGPLTQSSLFATGSAAEAPWRGSQLLWRTTITALTFDRGAELTYNPYAAMTFGLRPWRWFSERFYVRGQLDITRELTEPDTTTLDNEARLSDLHLVAGGAALWTLPLVGVQVSADLLLTLPTSKVSQAQTLLFSIAPGLRLSRAFAWRGGISLGYNVRITPRFYRYTTAERESPLIPGCASGCSGAFYNLGKRNPYLRLSQSFDISAKLLAWLGVYLVLGHAIDWIYDASAAPGISLETLEDTNTRHLTFFEFGVTFRPLDLLEVGIGYTALHPQLAPDSSRYTPFFNRYSALFLDLKVHLQDMISRIRRIPR